MGVSSQAKFDDIVLQLKQYPNYKTNIVKDTLFVYDGKVMHIIEYKNDIKKTGCATNLWHDPLLLTLSIIGISLGLVGILVVIVAAEIALRKQKKEKKESFIKIIG